MKIDESQKKQFIVLCCLIVFVIAFGAYRIVGMRTQAAPREQSSQVTEQTGQTGQAEEQAESRGTTAMIERPAANEMVKSKDPFTPQVDLQAGSSTFQPPSVSTPPPIMSLGPSMDIPFPGVSPVNPEIKVNALNNFPQPEEDPTSVLRLTGVIEGASNVAIIRGLDGARYIVREGQRIQGKYSVERISRVGVLIKFKGKDWVLRLGGNNAS